MALRFRPCCIAHLFLSDKRCSTLILLPTCPMVTGSLTGFSLMYKLLQYLRMAGVLLAFATSIRSGIRVVELETSIYTWACPQFFLTVLISHLNFHDHSECRWYAGTEIKLLALEISPASAAALTTCLSGVADGWMAVGRVLHTCPGSLVDLAVWGLALTLLGSACMALVYLDAGIFIATVPFSLGGEARPPSCALGLTRPMGGLWTIFLPLLFGVRFFFMYISY